MSHDLATSPAMLFRETTLASFERQLNSVKLISFKHEMDIKDDEIWSETSQKLEFLSADSVYNITAQKTEDDMTVIEL